MSGLVCWHGRVETVRDVGLYIAPAQRVALTGPNGSGRKTLLRAVLAPAPGPRWPSMNSRMPRVRCRADVVPDQRDRAAELGPGPDQEAAEVPPAEALRLVPAASVLPQPVDQPRPGTLA